MSCVTADTIKKAEPMQRYTAARYFLPLCVVLGTLVAEEPLHPTISDGSRWKEGAIFMLSWALTFLIVGLIAGILGLSGLAGAATQIAWILFVVFLVLFLVSMVMGRRVPPV
jgi:uncharacterized membrane protein YtjA (UPF0391 family)